MNDTEKPAPPWETLSAEEQQAALFANLVMQQTNAALLLLGQLPHPETGKAEVDLEGASLFIDTLEMLQARTRNNLSPQEETALKQSLTMLRMAFVQQVNASAGTRKEAEPGATASPGTTPTPMPPPPEPAEEESKKKFTKKY